MRKRVTRTTRQSGSPRRKGQDPGETKSPQMVHSQSEKGTGAAEKLRGGTAVRVGEGLPLRPLQLCPAPAKGACRAGIEKTKCSEHRQVLK